MHATWLWRTTYGTYRIYAVIYLAYRCLLREISRRPVDEIYIKNFGVKYFIESIDLEMLIDYRLNAFLNFV